jgi:hypothetical protein
MEADAVAEPLFDCHVEGSAAVHIGGCIHRRVLSVVDRRIVIDVQRKLAAERANVVYGERHVFGDLLLDAEIAMSQIVR